MNEKDYRLFKEYCDLLGLATFADIENFKKQHGAKSNVELLAAMSAAVNNLL